MAKLVIYEHEGDCGFVVEDAPAEILCRKLIEELRKGPEVFVQIESEEDPLLAHYIWWDSEEDFRNNVLRVKRIYGLCEGLAVPKSFTMLCEFVDMIFEFERGNEDD